MEYGKRHAQPQPLHANVAPGVRMIAPRSGTSGSSAGASTFSGCRVNGTATQSLASAVEEYIEWDNTEYDTDDFHDTAVNNQRITAPVAGYYRVFCTLGYVANSTGVRALHIHKNGVTATPMAASIIPAAASPNTTKLCVSADLHLDAGDYLAVEGYQTSGGALNVDLTDSHFGLTLIAIG